jgi:hypothetical protein
MEHVVNKYLKKSLTDTNHLNKTHETPPMNLRVTKRATRNEIKVEGNMHEAERGVRREKCGNDNMNEMKTKKQR